MGGQSLIKAAELRNVMQGAEEYKLALNNFVLRYGQYAGDFDQAERYWGAANASLSTCQAMDKRGVDGTCDGNGDGHIGGKTTDTRPEHYLFWHHLQKAGLIGGREYSGTWDADCGTGTCVDAHLPGTNCPDSAKGENIGWSVYFKNFSDAEEDNPNWFEGDYGHIFTFGAMIPGGAPNRPALSVTEVYSVDKKLDDGLPARGNVVVRTGEYSQLSECTETAPGSGVTTDHADLDAVYRLSAGDEIHCNMILRNLME